MNRKKELEAIKKSIATSLKFGTSEVAVAEGDSLNLLKSLPNHSISLILTDPPYHTTKKDNIHGDTSFREDEHYLEWMEQYAKEWKRLLKPNGSLFCFCSPAMSARLEVAFSKYFNILSQIVWTKPNDPGFDGWKQKMKKEALRQWYAHTERIIFAEPAFNGNLYRSYFGNLLREMRIKAGFTMHQLTALVGAHGRVNHGGAVSNWEAGRNIPSREQYKKLCDSLIETGKIKMMPPYEDTIRPFKIDATREFTDVWNFPSVKPYKGKHPAEKPIALLEHAIEATTYEGDIVLDCFGGSGNTGFAALRLDRLAVLMEIDRTWVSRSITKLKIGDWQDQTREIATRVPLIQKVRTPQFSLFSELK